MEEIPVKCHNMFLILRIKQKVMFFTSRDYETVYILPLDRLWTR